MSQSENERYWVGFDLGGTKMLSTIFDSALEVKHRKRRRTKANEGVDSGLKRIVQTIHRSVEEAGCDLTKIAGIGVGCPGPVEFERGILREAPNLGWGNVPVQEVLEREFQCPVFVLNDVDAGVFGEYSFGAAVNGRCVLGVFPGTGIGGGCVYEGRILRGKHFSCMEIGHVPVMPFGPLSGSGRRGSLEQVASRLAISAAAAQAAIRGEAPALLELAGTDVSKIRSGALAESIRAGDIVVEEIVREATEIIGIALSGIVHLLAPDVIVLGGGLVEAMPKLFVSGVSETVKRNVLESFTDSFRVVAAALGDDATAMGAAAWARKNVTENPGT